MPDETHKLQKDPPEGSRKVIEHELQRQAGRSGEQKPGRASAEAERKRDNAKDESSR